MSGIKEARLLRENFTKENHAEEAQVIIAEKAEVCITQQDFDQGKRVKNFTLIVYHPEGQIRVSVTMEQLKRWEKQIKELGHVMWIQGQKLQHYSAHEG